MISGRSILLAAAVLVTAAGGARAQSWILDSTYPVRVGTNSSVIMWPSQAAFIASNGLATVSQLTNAAPSVLPGRILVGNAASQTAAVAVSGDVTLATNGAVAIGARKITAAMLPQTLPGYILVGGATSNAAAVALSGDATLSAAGALSTVGITTNVVVLILGTGGSNTLTFVNGRLTAIQ